MNDDIPFSGGAFDRAAHLRNDDVFLAAARTAPDTRVLVLKDGAPFIRGARQGDQLKPGEDGAAGPRLIDWAGPGLLSGVNNERTLFLGLDAAGAACFAVDCTGTDIIAGDNQRAFEDARAAAGYLPAGESRLVATARSIFAWHARHRYCSNCGAATQVKEAGWKRECAACGGDHFPRVDPVAIMLAVHGDKCLLGRHDNWKPNHYSCLAGFIEPGETPEQGAARELFEEAGIRSTGVCEYLYSQPWPYPSSLMIGMIIEATSEELTLDEKEIAEAAWFTREEIKAILKGEHDIAVPPRVAVAHHMLRKWVED